MSALGKRRPRRKASGTSGLQGRGASPARESPPAENGHQGLTIERLAHDGRGVARHSHGKAVFVEGALPGERVDVAVHRAHKRFDEGHVRELLRTAPERVAPPCAHFSRCGGCDLQHLAVDAQRRHKAEVLGNLLARQGIDAPPVLSLAGASADYRRRARLGVKVDAEGRVHLGFRARGSHRLVDIPDCTILMPRLDALLSPLHDLVTTLEAPRHVGHLELLQSDAGAHSEDEHLLLVVRQLRDHPGDALRWQAFAQAHGLHLAQWLGRDSPSLHWLTATPSPSYRIPSPGGELTLGFGPGDFLQANVEVNRLMIDTALAWLGDVEGQTLLDLFAGVGNFSLPFSAGGARVTAVEGSPAMVERLAANARRNGLPLDARQADLAGAGVAQALLEQSRPEVVILDPPRAGAQVACLALAERPVERLLYVSCDPATLARDAAHLVHGGYRLTRIAMADMFVHTSHLESMLLFERPRTGQQPQGDAPDG